MDVDERKEQERLDAKLATQIAFGGGDYGRPSGRRRGLMLHGGRVSPEAVEEEEEHLLEKFASNKQEVCKAGSQCDRSVGEVHVGMFGLFAYKSKMDVGRGQPSIWIIFTHSGLL